MMAAKQCMFYVWLFYNVLNIISHSTAKELVDIFEL